MKQLAKKIDNDAVVAVILVAIVLGLMIYSGIKIEKPLMGPIMIGGALYLIGFFWGAKTVYKLCMDNHPGRYSTFYEVKDGLYPAVVGGLIWPLVLLGVLLVKLAKWGYSRATAWYKNRANT